MKKFAVIVAVLALGAIAYSRFGPTPPAPRPRPAVIPDSALNPKALKSVGEAYALSVEPLMKRACFDCHSTATVFPWYHSLPGVGWYLEGHVREGNEKLDLDGGFPFKGRAPIVFRVRGIGRQVQRGSMPLWDYKLMHPASWLSDAEKKTITDWSESSFQQLSQTARPYSPAPPKI